MGDQHHRALIVGGGQAGLATAYYLQKFGVDYLVLDNQEEPGGAWHHAWPSMTLFSTNEFSNLPGWPMPHHPDFPPASHVVDYLTRYEQRYQLQVQRPVQVDRVDYDGTFHLATSAGEYSADYVVAATGTWSTPFIPHYPGTFDGVQYHSAFYPGPEPFVGRSVAVVGAGNSGAQIAAELSAINEVTWYTRHEPRWMPDDVDGRVLFHRAKQRMLAMQRGEPDPGSESELGDIVVLPAVREARDSGRLVHTPMPASLDEIQTDGLIWCTGFRPALGPFRTLIHDRPPGLHLVGYGDAAAPGSATITGVGPFAKQAARSIADACGLEPGAGR